ncbi:MAG: DUF1599 domain-containing protein [Chloroflexia bacterium]|nr:DUF1599 domain-containing protein [Chloroflexia bacterium]
MNDTIKEFDSIIDQCRSLFLKKTADYGTSWRILRLPSITDQIWIKAQRIRTIQEVGAQKVEDPIKDEFIGIINYCIIALIQQHIESPKTVNFFDMGMPVNDVKDFYNSTISKIRILLSEKNHDYGEAWRSMRISSITDLILQKLIRIKSIEDNDGKTIVSEGISAGYQDIINYSVFSLILMGEADI